MSLIDDSKLALIMRFVGVYRSINLEDNEFIQKQLQIIRDYVNKFPPNERGLRANEWIELNARLYREVCKKEIITEIFADQRCPDCPLSGHSNLEHCQIHDQWIELLRQYVADDINTTKYVEDTLNLLTQHKEHLKIKLAASPK